MTEWMVGQDDPTADQDILMMMMMRQDADQDLLIIIGEVAEADWQSFTTFFQIFRWELPQ
jgi:hypothetical protein